MRIGLLTGGGDCPGLNAVIRGIVRKGINHDPAAGLADAALMARPQDDGTFPDFDTWHPWRLDADEAIDLALACEVAGREADARVENSDGASFGSGGSLSVYANSHGFVGRERETQHSLGVALIAGRGDGMQRDGWYSIGLAREDLEAPAAIGRRGVRVSVPDRTLTGPETRRGTWCRCPYRPGISWSPPSCLWT